MEQIITWIRKYISPISYDIAVTTFSLYIISSLIETVKKGVVVDYFNIQTMLVVAIISGFIAVLLPSQEKKISSKGLIGYWCVVLLLSISAGYYVWHYTQQEGVQGVLFGVLVSVVIVLAGYVLVSDNKAKQD